MSTELTEQLAAQLLDLTGDQRQGLPNQVFRLVSQLTPMINVDLLIQDQTGRTLLTWRADEFCGQGWHIPGGIIRFKETISSRITKVALTELGCEVEFSPTPIAMHEMIVPHRDIRGHFISLLYRCVLLTFPQAEQKANKHTPLNSQWKWHTDCPIDLIRSHEVYRSYIGTNLASA
jgi:ADP-ribose pyrophosphatase YjhB (NUDIX family)